MSLHTIIDYHAPFDRGFKNEEIQSFRNHMVLTLEVEEHVSALCEKFWLTI